jgi:hypothetical protein
VAAGTLRTVANRPNAQLPRPGRRITLLPTVAGPDSWAPPLVLDDQWWQISVTIRTKTNAIDRKLFAKASQIGWAPPTN